MEKIVFRHELKFLISEAEAEYLRHLLSCIMIKDEYAASKDYFIRSLYFDTLDDRDLNEKILGISERRKLRIRTYDVKSDFVKLEIKNKQGNYSVKETVTLSSKDAYELIRGNADILLNYENRIANKVYSYMKRALHVPAVIIDYEREAYMLPIENVRVTFDKNIRATDDKDFFSDKSVLINVINPGLCILEVKYDRFLPQYIADVLSSVTMQRMSISKYMHARSLF